MDVFIPSYAFGCPGRIPPYEAFEANMTARFYSPIKIGTSKLRFDYSVLMNDVWVKNIHNS
jgi:hypothetical protein